MFIKERGVKRKRITGLGLDHTHACNGKVMFNSFYDAGLKGEELNSGYWLFSKEYRDKIKQDKYYYANMLPLEKFRIEFTGKPWGFVPVFLPQLKKSPGVSKEWANSLEGAKDFLVLTLLHDCLVWPNWCNGRPVYETWLAKDKFGIADDDVEFLPYWKNSEYVSSSNDKIKVSIYRKKGRLLVIAANIAKTPKEAEIKINFANITALKKPSKVFDGITDEKLEIKDSTLKLNLPARDYKMIIIEGK
jgi:hypothetical protein